MTPAIIISRYADPDIAMRRRNVREAMGTCRWAVAQGYAPVCSLIHLADVNDPPEDTAGEVRERVTKYAQALARFVGAAGGVAIVPGWYEMTSGMSEDKSEFYQFHPQRINGGFQMFYRPTFAKIEPYMPRDLVGQVQAACVLIESRQYLTPDVAMAKAYRAALGDIDDETGITPSEVQ